MQQDQNEDWMYDGGRGGGGRGGWEAPPSRGRQGHQWDEGRGDRRGAAAGAPSSIGGARRPAMQGGSSGYLDGGDMDGLEEQGGYMTPPGQAGEDDELYGGMGLEFMVRGAFLLRRLQTKGHTAPVFE